MQKDSYKVQEKEQKSPRHYFSIFQKQKPGIKPWIGRNVFSIILYLSTFWIYNKAIIELGSRMILRFIKALACLIHLALSINSIILGTEVLPRLQKFQFDKNLTSYFIPSDLIALVVLPSTLVLLLWTLVKNLHLKPWCFHLLKHVLTAT